MIGATPWIALTLIMRTSAARSRSSRPGSSIPNTARRITSSVISCIRGRSANERPIGQVSSSRAVMSAITSR